MPPKALGHGAVTIDGIALQVQATFVPELHTHGVAAWTTDDIARAALMRVDCSQMRELFVPGFAANALDDVAWAQIHGPDKRLRVVASLLMEMGLRKSA